MKFLAATPVFKPTYIALALFVASVNVNAEGLVALSSANQIGVFDSSDSIINTTAFNTITGTAANEFFVGIDLRPSNNLIYGVTNANKIYTLDAYTGVSTFIASLSQSIIANNKSYGIDFNPVADRTTNPSLRLVSSTGDNYGINVTTGAVAVQSSIASGFTAASYINSDPSSSTAPASTGLYYVDAVNDTLGFAASAFNNPTITTKGSLGVDILNSSGFEITNMGSAFGAFTEDSNGLQTGLYALNLGTGAATKVSAFIGTVGGLTSAPIATAVPEPETYAMLLAGLGLMGFTASRKAKLQKV